MSSAWMYTLIPAAAAVLGAVAAVNIRPGPRIVSAIQHLAAGVVFAAAAGEILPDLMHRNAPVATVVGGGIALAVMLAIKQVEGLVKCPLGLLSMVGVDILIDGLVLGIGFSAGAKAGILLTVALTLEVLFLGLTVANELGESVRSRLAVVGATAALALLLPLGAVLATPIAALPPSIVAGFFAFGLIALLYLVTEELLVEAHQTPDRPWVTAMFFVGFLAILVLEELMS